MTIAKAIFIQTLCGAKYNSMINNDLLNKLTINGRMAGHEVKVRDICFVLLCRYIEDKATVYRSLFDPNGTVSEVSIDNYKNSRKIAYLEDELRVQVPEEKKKKKKAGDDISFDENLAYMLRLKKETEEALANKEIDKKDGLKILADITVKLNDKFNIAEEVKDQVVVVAQKYDDICPYCQHEVARRPLAKEEAMEMYNLTEK